MRTAEIKDRRVLTLPMETAVDALVEFDKVQHGELWRARVNQVEVGGEANDPTLRVVALPDGASEPVEKTFDAPTVAAAIILYCGKAGIPLPRKNSVKSITLAPDGAATLTVETKVRARQLHRSPDLEAAGADAEAADAD